MNKPPNLMQRAFSTDSATFATLLILVALLASSCTSTDPIADYYGELERDVNRLVLEREGSSEPLTKDAPALAFYDDVREVLDNEGYAIAASDEDEYILTTEPRMVNGVALRIMVNVDPMPGGSRAIVSSDWAPTVASSDWQAAAWTDGLAQDAFEATIDAFDNLAASDRLYGIE